MMTDKFLILESNGEANNSSKKKHYALHRNEKDQKE
jgi:hypothetical protein